MADINDILAALPIDQLAAQVGATPEQVQQAVQTALPTLVGGLEANARDEAGAASLSQALSQHDGSVLDGGVDVGSIDTADGERITQHIFGDNTNAVVNQLGGGLPDGLIGKLLPLLAPIVLGYLAKQMGGSSSSATGKQAGQASQAGQGGLGDILGSILGGGSSGGSGGLGGLGGLGDVLGGLLGGGRR